MLLIMYLIPLIVGVLIVQYIWKCYTSTKEISKLPGPPTLPLLGNLLLLNDSQSALWEKFRKWSNDYYPTFSVWGLTLMSAVFIRHPDDIQVLDHFKVLITSKININKGDQFYSYVRKYGQDGILVSEGKKWHNRRAMIQQGFLYNNFTRSIAEKANKYTELIIQEMLSWDNESIHDVLPVTFKFSFDVACNSILGCDSYTIGAQQSEEFRNAVSDFLNLIFYRAARPYLTDWIVKFLPLEREINKTKLIVRTFLKRVLEERQNYYKINGINLLSDKFTDEVKNTRDDPENTKGKSLNKLDILETLCIYNAKGLIDEAGIFEEIEGVLAAGYDSTAFTIAFTLLLLAENENEQNLARKEVNDFMKKNGNKFTSSEVQNLKYLDRCIKEALRLFPTVPWFGRKLVEDTKLSNYVIPRNTDVIASFFDLHRDPNFWSEPNKFNPDRFLPEFTKDRHPYAYLPFGSGARYCMGQKQAVIEIKIILAHILYNFYLKPVDFTHDLSFMAHPLLHPTADKLRVKFIKIR